MPHPEPALDIIAPVAYSPLWLVLGGLLVVAVLGWVAAVWWRTRTPRARPATVAPPGPDPREACLARIAMIRRRATAGELTARVAAQSLSAEVRGFIGAMTGTPVDAMNLDQLRRLAAHDQPVGATAPGSAPGVPARPGLADLADYVAGLYPPEFAPDLGVDPGAVDRAAVAAERLVREWP